MSMPSDVTPDITDAMEAGRAREMRYGASDFTPEQRAWAVAAFVAFLGVAVVGPAVARALNPERSMRKKLARRAEEVRGRALETGRRVRKRIRRLGGGSFTR